MEVDMLLPVSYEEHIPNIVPFFLMLWVACFFEIERLRKKILPRRWWWTFPRSIHQWDVMYQKVYLLDNEMRDEVWFRDFRMKYSTFVTLCDLLKPYIEHQDTNYRDAVPVQKAVAMVLHKLAHAGTNRNVGNMFGVGKKQF